MADTTLARALVAASFLISFAACPPDPEPENPDECFGTDCHARVHAESCPALSVAPECSTHVACTTNQDCTISTPYPGFCDPSADGGTVCTWPLDDGTRVPACFLGSAIYPITTACSDGVRLLTCNDGRVCRARECIVSCAQWAAEPITCKYSATLRMGLCQGPADVDLQNIMCFGEDGRVSAFGCSELSDGGAVTDAGVTDAGSTDAGSTDAGSTDAGSTDAGSTDAGSTDAGSTDAGTDAGSTLLPDGGVLPLANIFNFAFDRTLIATGDTATLSWVVAQDPAAQCTISPGNVSFDSSVTPTGSMQVGTSGTSTLSCTTAAGTITQQATLVVVTNTPPNATIDSPAMSTTWEVGDAITFTGTCTDDGAGSPTLSHVWNFGALTSPAMMFDFSEDPAPVTATTPGTFTVTYDCADALGVTDPTPASMTITVVDPVFATVKGVRSLIGHTCGLTASGKLFCWGTSSFGVLGQGPTAVDTSRPKRVGNALWASFDVGTRLSCAINAAHELWCWGSRIIGSNPSIGNGMTTLQDSPVQLPGNDWASVSLGNNHACAVKTSGALHCWGENAEGQLGVGASTAAQLAFAPVNGDLDWVAVAAGDRSTCALKTGNRLFCWGRNDYGQLGSDSLDPWSTTPVTPVGLTSGVNAIAAGRSHVCVSLTAGGAKCWGSNLYGEQGIGMYGNGQHSPVSVTGLTGTTSVGVGAGESNSFLVMSNGELRAWGRNADGELGNGQSGFNVDQYAPVQVSGVTSGATSVSAGYAFACAVIGGAAKCWGNNFYLVLGNGSSSSTVVTAPTQVTGLTSGVTALSATASDHACAIVAGAVKCWGNAGPHLGTGDDQTNAPTPVSVVSLP
jgi:alpha-tubulin suppressor-like RCC1 family protein